MLRVRSRILTNVELIFHLNNPAECSAILSTTTEYQAGFNIYGVFLFDLYAFMNHGRPFSRLISKCEQSDDVCKSSDLADLHEIRQTKLVD